MNPLYYAVNDQNEELVRKILSEPHTSDDVNNNEYFGGRGPLHYAANNNLPKFISILLTDPLVDPNRMDDCGYTPFYYACSNNSVESARELLKCDRVEVCIFQIHPKHGTCCSAFSEVVSMSHLKILKFWIASGRRFPMNDLYDWEMKIYSAWKGVLTDEIRGWFYGAGSEAEIRGTCELLSEYFSDPEATKLRLSLEIKAEIS
jgi:hypothetical protein